MNTEEILEGARKLSEAFGALGCTISELADAIDRAFLTLFSTQEIHPEHEDHLPKTSSKDYRPLLVHPERAAEPALSTKSVLGKSAPSRLT